MPGSNFIFALGLAQKAGKAVSGDFAVHAAFKGGRVRLLLVASDAAPNTKKDLYSLAADAQGPVEESMTVAAMGQAIGKGRRMAVAITDMNFAKMLQKRK